VTGIVYGLFIAQLFTAVYTKVDHIRSYFMREISLLNDLMLSCSLWSACIDADKLEVLLLIRNYALSIAREVKLDVIDEEEEANQRTNSSISGRQSHAQQAERAAADIEDLYGVLALLTTATGSGEGKVEISSSPSSPPPPPLLAVQPQQIAATLMELAGAKLQRLSLMRCSILSFNTSLALLIMTGFMYCKIITQKETARNHLFFFPCSHLVLTMFRCHFLLFHLETDGIILLETGEPMINMLICFLVSSSICLCFYGLSRMDHPFEGATKFTSTVDLKVLLQRLEQKLRGLRQSVLLRESTTPRRKVPAAAAALSKPLESSTVQENPEGAADSITSTSKTTPATMGASLLAAVI
jgi:hypothetical protein